MTDRGIVRTIGGSYFVVLTQLLGWLTTIAILTAAASLVAGAITDPVTVEEGLLIGTWVAILAGGPVAITGAVVCLRRFLRNGDWPTFGRTARIAVTVAWAIMAIVLGAASDSIVSGLPWYGMITVGVWFIAPWVFRLAPTGAPT